MSYQYDWLVDYFRIRGRITREQYVLRVVGRYVFFAVAIVALLFISVYLRRFFEFISSIFPFIHNIFYIFIDSFFMFSIFICLILFVIFKYAQEIKRLHDMNYSGWFILIGFIPLIHIIYYLVLIFKDGTIGQNEYGPDPKNRIAEGEEYNGRRYDGNI